jgi:hypothetical protein
MPLDATNGLAHGMPERESVWWACQSSQKVATKLNPEEAAAQKAAEAWVKNPSPATQSAAQAAASKTDYSGPGGWAAQAAAWSKPAASAPATATPAPSLTAAAVSGSVLLASGLAKRPAMGPPQRPVFKAPDLNVPQPQPEPPSVDQSKLAEPMNPFLQLGKDVASGKNTWA